MKKKKMNSKFLFLILVLAFCTLVFVWGTANYLRCYTDTPSENYMEQCPTNIDVYAIPALVVTFVTIGIVPIITWMKAKHHKFRAIFIVLSGVGIFFTFIGILNLIFMVRA